jgi:hypothetical protein
MEIYSKDVHIGSVKVELSVQETRKTCRMILTAKDDTDTVLWRATMADPEGRVKTYSSVADAFRDAEEKLKSYG